MGCSAPGGFQMFGRRSADAEDLKAKLERKLYLARESPDATFDLSQCGLKNVPTGIYSLCKVFRKESLNLEDNSLSTLEDGGDLKDLFLIQLLSVAKNKFHKLPGEIRYLINLRELYLNNNELKHLPDSIGDLEQLRILDVSNNSLKCLPASLGRLKRLSRLSLRENRHLKTLCKDLCNAHNLTIIELDASNFIYPSPEILNTGVAEIMKFLCQESNIEYVEPIEINDSVSPAMNSPYAVLSPAEQKNLKTHFADWEAHDEHIQRLENEVHEAAKRQREKFLEEYALEQKKLDSEFNKIQQEKDIERVNLVKQIQDDERQTEEIVIKLLQMSLSNPQRIQQFLEHDQVEHDRLLEMCRTNYISLKKTDTLKAMESLLQEECAYEKSLKNYGETQSEVTQSFLLLELDANYQLSDLLKTRGDLQSSLVAKLLEDENLQKAAVGSLLAKCDGRTWGLIQEITLVESHLAKLSTIELDRRKLQLDENFDNLAKQRIMLTGLLVDLLDQQEQRRAQLLDTLHAMELEKSSSTDFWLIRYQQLLETVPEKVISSQQQLDPLFANYLLQEGVIHCLPFLVRWVWSKNDLVSLTDDMLLEQGVRLSSDRFNILKAIRLYVEEMDATCAKINRSESPTDIQPSAPILDDFNGDDANSIARVSNDAENNETECVICMENSCVVVFIPCGHLCCCLKCSDSIDKICPMCRQDIERKIRVIQP